MENSEEKSVCEVSASKESVPYGVRLLLIFFGIGILLDLMGLLRQEGKLKATKTYFEFTPNEMGKTLMIRKDELRSITLKESSNMNVLVLETGEKTYKIKFQGSAWINKDVEKEARQFIEFLKENYDVNIA